MPKSLGEHLRKKLGICLVSNTFPKIFINYKKENTYSRETQQTLPQSGDTVSNKTDRHHVPLVWCTEKARHFGGGLPKLCTLCLIMRKHETNPGSSLGYCKVTDQGSIDTEFMKDRKDCGTVTDWQGLRRQDNHMQHVVPDSILRQRA